MSYGISPVSNNYSITKNSFNMKKSKDSTTALSKMTLDKFLETVSKKENRLSKQQIFEIVKDQMKQGKIVFVGDFHINDRVTDFVSQLLDKCPPKYFVVEFPKDMQYLFDGYLSGTITEEDFRKKISNFTGAYSDHFMPIFKKIKELNEQLIKKGYPRIKIICFDVPISDINKLRNKSNVMDMGDLYNAGKKERREVVLERNHAMASILSQLGDGNVMVFVGEGHINNENVGSITNKIKRSSFVINNTRIGEISKSEIEDLKSGNGIFGISSPLIVDSLGNPRLDIIQGNLRIFYPGESEAFEAIEHFNKVYGGVLFTDKEMKILKDALLGMGTDKESKMRENIMDLFIYSSSKYKEGLDLLKRGKMGSGNTDISETDKRKIEQVVTALGMKQNLIFNFMKQCLSITDDAISKRMEKSDASKEAGVIEKESVYKQSLLIKYLDVRNRNPIVGLPEPIKVLDDYLQELTLQALESGVSLSDLEYIDNQLYDLKNGPDLPAVKEFIKQKYPKNAEILIKYAKTNEKIIRWEHSTVLKTSNTFELFSKIIDAGISYEKILRLAWLNDLSKRVDWNNSRLFHTLIDAIAFKGNKKGEDAKADIVKALQKSQEDYENVGEDYKQKFNRRVLILKEMLVLVEMED